MGRRKVPLACGCFYHIFNRSIAGFEIFRYPAEYQRFRATLRYYKTAISTRSFSIALRLNKLNAPEMHGPDRVRILAYCLMPTHFHLFLEQLAPNGIEDYVRFIEAGYAHFFNLRSKRRGPLWESRFENRLVEADPYALHLMRYIHLNPVSTGLAKKAEGWEFSSYHEHLARSQEEPLCAFKDIMDLSPATIKKFTDNRADYQRSLALIKGLILD
ncbi:MAG: hypothetical protein WC133_06815 [Candidatus Omnitrophota bacterium]